MHPQYCLDVIFDMIKQLHKYNPSLYTKILLHLLKAADIAYVTVACNILFVEGPVNDYKEEAILIKHVCKNMALIINNLINDPTITADVKTFSSNMITDTLAFIKSIEESPAMQHYSHITSSIHKIQLVLDVLQLIDDSVKPLQLKLVSLFTPV